MSVDAPTSSVVEAAALTRLHGYLRRAPDRTEAEEIVARDAYVQGFKSGGAYAIRQCTGLSDPQFRTALCVVAEFVRLADGEARRARELHAVAT